MNYKLNEEAVFSDVTDGIAVIINSQTGVYYGMNAFATNIYENIIDGVNVDKILAAIKQMPNVPENFEANFKKFIEEMVEKEILIQTEDSSAEQPTLDEKLAQEGKYDLIFQEFVDAQELLLADPIHEVKEEVGWTPEKDSIGYTKEETREREKKVK